MRRPWTGLRGVAPARAAASSPVAGYGVRGDRGLGAVAAVEGSRAGDVGTRQSGSGALRSVVRRGGCRRSGILGHWSWDIFWRASFACRERECRAVK